MYIFTAQVCIPGLHLSLGIFNRLFTLLEDACEDLDAKLAENVVTAGGASFRNYSVALKHLKEVVEKQHHEQQKLKLFTQICTHLSVSLPAPEESVALQQVRQVVIDLQQELATLIRIYIRVQCYKLTHTHSL